MNQGRIILVTGGSRSGKSEYAENLLAAEEKILYIATAVITDEEMERRIEKHRSRRDSRWRTHEGYKNLSDAIEGCSEKSVLLDCVTFVISNMMFEKQMDFDSMTMDEAALLQNRIKEEFTKIASAARRSGKKLVMVTNEVGCGLVPEYKSSRIYRDMTGFVNQHIASLSDEVYLVACGLPLKLKG